MNTNFRNSAIFALLAATTSALAAPPAGIDQPGRSADTAVAHSTSASEARRQRAVRAAVRRHRRSRLVRTQPAMARPRRWRSGSARRLHRRHVRRASRSQRRPAKPVSVSAISATSRCPRAPPIRCCATGSRRSSRSATATTARRPSSRTSHYTPTVTIENSVLDDPSLIDPTTGLPFGGQLLTGMTSSQHFDMPLPATTHITERTRDSAVCIAGLISREHAHADLRSQRRAGTRFFPSRR